MRTRSNTTSYGTVSGPSRVGRTYVMSANQALTGLPVGTIIADYNPHYWPLMDLGYKTESISDDIESKKKDKFGSVEHWVTDFEKYPSEYGYTLSENGAWATVTNCGLSTWYPEVIHPYVPLEARFVACDYAKTDQQLINEAAHRFYSDNEANNLLNMIEFRQLRDGLVGSTQFMSRLLHIVQSPFNTWRNSNDPRLLSRAARERFGFRSYLRNGWWHKSLKALASEYLAFQFGYAPLVSDLGKTARGLSHLRRDLKRIAANGMTRMTATSYCIGSYRDMWSGQQGYASTAPSTPDSTWWHPNDYSNAPRRLAGVSGLKSRQFYSAGFQAADYLLKTYVSTGPATLAWELVPFSFVLDWFLDLTPILDAVDNTLIGNVVQLKDFWLSEKRDIRYDIVYHRSTQHISKDGSLYIDPNIGVAIGRCSTKYYRRYKTDLRPKLELSHRFGKKQGTLTGALLIQTVANLKSKI